MENWQQFSIFVFLIFIYQYFFMKYNEFMNFVEIQLTQDEDDQAQTFEANLDHRKTKKGKYELLVKWTTGEETWVSLSVISRHDSMTVAMYVVDQQLLTIPE